MNRQCSGITREGARCARSVEGPNGLCWLHDPTRLEERKRAASKAGKSKPNRELIEIKQRLSDLATDVLDGNVDRSDAGVVSQVYNVLLRAISTELKVQEQLELQQRLEELEAALEAQEKRGQHRGA